MIGAKEEVVESLTTFVGTDITDAVLQWADGDYKGLNKYTLQELLQAAIDRADRPPATDFLTQLLEAINFVFNFRKKISANMEGMQALTARMKTYGIDVSTPQVVLTLMANIDVAARIDFGQEFRPALQNIRAKYTYSHTHDNVSLRDILQELAKAASVRTLKDAPDPGTANTVTTMLEKMCTTGNYNSSDNDDYT